MGGANIVEQVPGEADEVFWPILVSVEGLDFGLEIGMRFRCLAGVWVGWVVFAPSSARELLTRRDHIDSSIENDPGAYFWDDGCPGDQVLCPLSAGCCRNGEVCCGFGCCPDDATGCDEERKLCKFGGGIVDRPNSSCGRERYSCNRSMRPQGGCCGRFQWCSTDRDSNEPNGCWAFGDVEHGEWAYDRAGRPYYTTTYATRERRTTGLSVSTENPISTKGPERPPETTGSGSGGGSVGGGGGVQNPNNGGGNSDGGSGGSEGGNNDRNGNSPDNPSDGDPPNGAPSAPNLNQSNDKSSTTPLPKPSGGSSEGNTAQDVETTPTNSETSSRTRYRLRYPTITPPASDDPSDPDSDQPPNLPSSNGPPTIPKKAFIGIAFGAFFGLLLIIAAGILFYRWWIAAAEKKRRESSSTIDTDVSRGGMEDLRAFRFAKRIESEYSDSPIPIGARI